MAESLTAQSYDFHYFMRISQTVVKFIRAKSNHSRSFLQLVPQRHCLMGFPIIGPFSRHAGVCRLFRGSCSVGSKVRLPGCRGFDDSFEQCSRRTATLFLSIVAYRLQWIIEAENQTVLVYETAEGRAPFSDWMKRLKDRRARAKIRARIARVQLGNFGDCRSVGGGVAELRVSYGPGYRVYFGRQDDTVVVLLLAGDKRTQSDDIDRAQAYWKEVQRCR